MLASPTFYQPLTLEIPMKIKTKVQAGGRCGGGAPGTIGNDI
jgi:hypothetical protein